MTTRIHNGGRAMVKTTLAKTLVCLLATTAIACGGDDISAPPTLTELSTFYHRMDLNHRAVTLSPVAPYDTLQLTVTPYAADGSIMQTDTKPEFLMVDSSSIRVTPDGLLRAAAASGTADVFVSLTINGVAKRDTITVTIFPSAPLPTLASAKIVPPPDSTKRPPYTFYAVTTQVKDTAGRIIGGIPVRLWIKDTTHIKFERRRSRVLFGGALGAPLGSGWLHLSSTVFGQVLQDSMEWTVGQQLAGTFRFQKNEGPGPMLSLATGALGIANSLEIGVGGVVTWQFPQSDTLTDIVFDDSTAASRDPASADGVGGNIAPLRGAMIPGPFFPSPIARSRKFSRPGAFRFYSTLHEFVGTVYVRDERKCLPDCPPFPVP